MPNQVTTTGLQTKTQAELVADFTAAFQAIYGTDIDLTSSSPDGQLMYTFIQSTLDVLDLLTQVYNGFDPDTALGVVLDNRVAINGIQRQAGTFTTTNVTIVTSQALTLPGLDLYPLAPYTVADNAGNSWQLVNTQHPASNGTYVYVFQSAVTGAVLTTPNTITVPVSVVLGVVSINNPTTYTVLGINEESDAALKIRRQKSVTLASQGYLAGLLAALENINGIISAFIHENVTDTTDSDGVPGHSIWVIVNGGTAALIADAIYKKRNAGCGMYGAQSYVITQADGSLFRVYWDNVVAQNVFIKFTATSLDGLNAPNVATIKAGIPGLLVPTVYEQININDLATLVQTLDNNCLVTSAGFATSAGGAYSNALFPTAKNYQFSVLAANIIILPILLTPGATYNTLTGTHTDTVNVTHSTTQQLTPYGGYPAYTYAMQTNVSGGSVNASTGLYTAGSTLGVDVVRVTDSLGNTGDARINVT